MKVLIYSYSFYPNVGGIETVSMTLATELIAHKIDCKVITHKQTITPSDLDFEIFFDDSIRKVARLVRWADIILFNGVSLALQPWILIYRKPFIWIHGGYQVTCVDGLGWVKGQAAPLDPYSSIIYHVKRRGLIAGLQGGIKLLVKRFFAKRIVSKNVAITKWMMYAQPLPRQIHIYNPFQLDKFKYLPIDDFYYDFFYLGRIVSEKGISTLLNAFYEVKAKVTKPVRLLIIGDGELKGEMIKLTSRLSISESVTFIGSKSGSELAKWVAKSKIAIVPSEYFEPMGIVALELMAAGRNLIVSEYGGLKECVGSAALTFPNGDYKALSNCMTLLLEDEQLRNSQLRAGKERLEFFVPEVFVEQYISLLKEVVNSN